MGFFRAVWVKRTPCGDQYGPGTDRGPSLHLGRWASQRAGLLIRSPMVPDAESYQPRWISESPSTGYDKDRREVWVPGCQSEAEDVAKVLIAETRRRLNDLIGPCRQEDASLLSS